ncbi:necrosis inducing protein [Fusarium heterosporum]|uniref:Necrosis inducing protein n=1 Tax=Fusarium heterosporum TaxID=42747 RepID=A0A8H5WYC0_FUSHE|nr:necrosis inducing protein [Fusarium heterosporum]
MFNFTAKTLTILLAITAVANPIQQLYREVLEKRDPPRALDSNASDEEKKWQPAMDFDTDGCYNVPAIDKDGNVSPGMKAWMQYNFAKDCRDESDLDNNNVYVRTRCNNGWCAYLYAYYFEKDVGSPGVIGPAGGHTHDWEHVVVFVKDNEGAKVVAVSQHSDYETRRNDGARWHDNTHVKVVYHKDGGQTHAFRFANEGDDAIENHKKSWFFGGLVGWNGFPNTGVRDKLTGYDFGSAALAIRDGSFKPNLDKARDDSNDGSNNMVPGFDSGFDQ